MTVQLLWLAAPIVLMMLSRLAMTFIDFVMVSQLGTEAQAAISPASIFVFVVGCLGLGVAHAVQTYVSQVDGRGEPHEAGAYAWQSYYIAIIFGLITLPAAWTAATWFGWIADLGQHSPAVRAMEISYIEIGLWSVAPSIVCIGLNGFFMGVQRPWIAFIAVTASLAANALGNWLLIFGNLGFPELGIRGAAYATVAAWIVRAIVLSAAMLLPYFHRRYNTWWSAAPDLKRLAGLIRVGAPTSLGWLVDLGSWSAFMILIIPAFGTVAMAATNVALQLMHVSFMPALGIGIALCSQVGFAIGEGKPELAFKRSSIAYRLTGGYMGLVGLLFLFAREPLIYVFNQDPEVVSVGATILIWAAVFQVFDAMAITYINALRGAGDTRWPSIVMGVACLVLFIGGGWLLSRFVPQWGISGPWSMCAIYIIVVGLLVLWRWYGGAWRSIRLFDEKHPAPTAAEVPDEAPMSAVSESMAAPEEPELEQDAAPAPTPLR